jgi:hypothetical protein
MFALRKVFIPEIHAAWLEWKCGPQHESFMPCIVSPRPEWHERLCAVYGYYADRAAICFKDSDKHDYEIIKAEYLK